MISYRAAIVFLFVFVFTPLYYSACRGLYPLIFRNLTPQNEIFIYALMALYVGVYIFCLYQLIAFLQALDRRIEPSTRRQSDFLSTRSSRSFLRDEIDILHDSMKTMRLNLQNRNKELAVSRAQMQELVQATLRSQEAEKRILAHELHDESGFILTSLRVKTAALWSELESGSTLQAADVREAFADILKEIDRVYQRLHTLSHNLRPALLDVGDINLAMQEYCSDFQKTHRVIVSYFGDPLPAITEETSTVFFRFLQEALANVVKHANATEVAVTLTAEKGRIRMSVRDNGLGAGGEFMDSGIGLRGMQERFNLLNGSVEAVSSSSGFTLTGTVPCSDLTIKKSPL